MFGLAVSVTIDDLAATVTIFGLDCNVTTPSGAGTMFKPLTVPVALNVGACISNDIEPDGLGSVAVPAAEKVGAAISNAIWPFGYGSDALPVALNVGALTVNATSPTG